MSDFEEPPVKVTKYDMNNQYLEGEVMEEGQEEWLSEGLLTDDDEYTTRQSEQDETVNMSQDTLGSMETSHETDLNETQTSQESQEPERPATRCSVDSDATNASYVLDTSQIGVQNEIVEKNDAKNIEEKLNDLQKSRDATPDLPDDLDAFLVRKTKVVTSQSLRESSAENQAQSQKKETKSKVEEEDGNDTDDLLRVLEDGNNKKTKKLHKKAKVKQAESSDDDDDADLVKGAKSKNVKPATKALTKKKTPTKAVPEEDITDASSEDDAPTREPINLRSRSKHQNTDTNKQRQQQQKAKSNKQQEVKSKQVMNKQKQDEQIEQQQKLLNRYQPKSVSGASYKSFVIKEPLLQLQKIDIKKQETVKISNTPKQQESKPKPVGQSKIVARLQEDQKRQLKQHMLQLSVAKQKQQSVPKQQQQQKAPKQQQQQSVTKQQILTRLQNSGTVVKKPVLKFVNTLVQPENKKPPFITYFNKKSAVLSSPPPAPALAPQVVKEKEKAPKKQEERSEEIINEKEFMEDEAIDLNEQFVKKDTPVKEEAKQRLMRPESMDEEVPSDMESDDGEESIYDELPSSESDTCDDWFTIDIRAERAAEYLPLLGENAYEILTEEKKRVTAKVEEARQRLEELTNSGRSQAEQLKKATLALAELDAALGAA